MFCEFTYLERWNNASSVKKHNIQNIVLVLSGATQVGYTSPVTDALYGFYRDKVWVSWPPSLHWNLNNEFVVLNVSETFFALTSVLSRTSSNFCGVTTLVWRMYVLTFKPVSLNCFTTFQITDFEGFVRPPKRLCKWDLTVAKWCSVDVILDEKHTVFHSERHRVAEWKLLNVTDGSCENHVMSDDSQDHVMSSLTLGYI